MVAEAALAARPRAWCCLANEPEEFIESSVDLPGTNWVDRFRRVLDASEVKVQTAEMGPLPDGEIGTGATTRGPSRSPSRRLPMGSPHVVAVWDRVASDKPGGTSDFVTQARDRGHQIDIIDPTRTFRYRGPPKARNREATVRSGCSPSTAAGCAD